MMINFAAARKNMVDCQIHPSGVVDDRILAAFEATPREDYVPLDRRLTAYQDEYVDLGQGNFIMEPQAHARMLSVAGLRANDVVLDIGGASGYSSAILSSLVTTVIALEDHQGMLDQSKQLWAQHNVFNVAGILGTLIEGCPSYAPYDLIVINGAVSEIPQVLLDQIAPQGRLVCIVMQSGQKMGKIICVHKDNAGHISQSFHYDASAPYVSGFEPRKVFVF